MCIQLKIVAEWHQYYFLSLQRETIVIELNQVPYHFQNQARESLKTAYYALNSLHPLYKMIIHNRLRCLQQLPVRGWYFLLQLLHHQFVT